MSLPMMAVCLLSKSDLVRPSIFSCLKILVTFVILDDTFGITPLKMWLWLLMGHRLY